MSDVEVPTDDNDPFVKKVALCVAVFAVVLALAAAGGNNAGKDMLMNQLRASNEWSQFQAKSQREVLYAQEREQMDELLGPVDPAAAKTLGEQYDAAQKDRTKLPADSTERRKLRHGYVTSKLIEYKKEKEDLAKKANEFQDELKLAQKKDPFFDTAELLLQIGIVLLSVAMLSKARWAFAAGCVLAAGGLALTVMGYFFPEVPVPFVSVAE